MSIRHLGAEAIGSFALVTVICGTALLAAPSAGLVAVALASGLMAATMTVALQHVSGGHLNPIVTLGLVAGGRFDVGQAVPYLVAQTIGAVAAALVVWIILAGAPSGTGIRWNTFLSIANMHGDARQFSLAAVIVSEAVAAALLVIVVMGSTSRSATAVAAPLAIGCAYVALHLMLIPISNGGLNPARATATALIAGPTALAQVWVYWVAPLAGAVAGGLIGRWLDEE
jgi:aquaporin Z